MKTLHQLSLWLWAVLKPLGAWGVFAIAAIDGAGIPVPGATDALVASYVYGNPLKAWLYVLMAALGSALGCCVLYVIGYVGGEVVLQKRMPAWRFEKIRRSFERHKFLALMVPAMLPPPFPFKVFVLGASVFEMKLAHFLLAIFSGRLVRYGGLALLTAKFGPGVVSLTAVLIRRNWIWLLLIMGAAIIAVLLLWRLRGHSLAEGVE